MDSRAKEMWEYISPLVESRKNIDSAALSTTWAKHKNFLVANFATMLKGVVARTNYLVDTGQKGAPAFAVFSFLNTGFLLKDYCLQLDILDMDFFLDDVECSGRFSYDPLIEQFEDSIVEFTSLIKEQYSRCMDYELDLIRWKYKDVSLFDLCLELLKLILEESAVKRELSELSYGNGVRLNYMYGYYFNQQRLFGIEAGGAAS